MDAGGGVEGMGEAPDKPAVPGVANKVTAKQGEGEGSAGGNSMS